MNYICNASPLKYWWDFLSNHRDLRFSMQLSLSIK